MIFACSILALVALMLARNAMAAEQVTLRFGVIDKSVRNIPRPLRLPPASSICNI